MGSFGPFATLRVLRMTWFGLRLRMTWANYTLTVILSTFASLSVNSAKDLKTRSFGPFATLRVLRMTSEVG